MTANAGAALNNLKSKKAKETVQRELKEAKKNAKRADLKWLATVPINFGWTVTRTQVLEQRILRSTTVNALL
jgi:hypothetical protein